MTKDTLLMEAEAERDAAYKERNILVALLARMWPSARGRTPITGWDPEWHNCVYIEAPAGQLSWHYHDSEASLFDSLPESQPQWDGHSTEEKYERIKWYIRRLEDPSAVGLRKPQ